MNRLSAQTCAVFIFGLAFILFLYAGLPFDFSQDMVRDERLAQDMSDAHLWGYVFNPLTPGWFFYSKMDELRPIYFILHKFFFNTFGPDLLPVHVTVALGFGLLLTVLFLIVHHITGRKLFGWLTVLLYASFPTHALMISGYLALDLQFFLSVVTLGSVALFFLATWTQESSPAKKALRIVAWFLLTWLAIKWKSSEKILPFVFLAFLILRLQTVSRRVGQRQLVILFLMTIAMFTLVVPLKPVPPPQDVTEEELQKIFIKKDENMFRMSIPNLLARTFVMPDSENPLTTVELDQLPNTLTGNMGFFLGWFFWLGMIFTPILWLRAGHRGRPKGSHEEQFQRRLHGFILVVIWFFAVIAAFATGAPLGEVRYLNYAYIPATLLIGFMIRLIEDAFLLRLPARTWFAIVVSVLVGFTILQNIKFLKKWVCHFGGMQHAISESEKIIHTSFFGQTPAGMVLYNRHGELEERAVLVLWYELPADWFDQAMDRLQRENVLFVKTREESDPKLERFRDRGREVEKLAVISLDDAKPAIFRVQRWLEQAGLRRSKNRNVFVFKIR